MVILPAYDALGWAPQSYKELETKEISTQVGRAVQAAQADGSLPLGPDLLGLIEAVGWAELAEAFGAVPLCRSAVLGPDLAALTVVIARTERRVGNSPVTGGLTVAVRRLDGDQVEIDVLTMAERLACSNAFLRREAKRPVLTVDAADRADLAPALGEWLRESAPTLRIDIERIVADVEASATRPVAPPQSLTSQLEAGLPSAAPELGVTPRDAKELVQAALQACRAEPGSTLFHLANGCARAATDLARRAPAPGAGSRQGRDVCALQRLAGELVGGGVLAKPAAAVRAG